MKIPTAIEFIESIQRSTRDEKSESLIEEQAKSLISELYCNQIIEALKKQTLMKVEAILYENDKIFMWSCPNCNMANDNSAVKMVVNPYCCFCGQKVEFRKESLREEDD